MSDNTIVVIQLITFWYSSVYSCHLLSFSACYALTISVLYPSHPCMEYSLDNSKFLDLLSLTHSIVAQYFSPLFILMAL